MRLGILASHPIQYQAPWFRGLVDAVDLQVFFAHRQSAAEQGKAGFGVVFDWDVDLLSGYPHTFLENKSARPGVNHFFGCNTPEIYEIIRAGKFDAFIVTGWNLKSYWQAVRACRRNKIPVLVRGDSQLNTPLSLVRKWVKEIAYRIMLKRFDGFLVVGKKNSEYLAYYGVPEKKMFSAPHFVDNDRFARQANQIRNEKSSASAQGYCVTGRSEIRDQWGIPESAFCVLFCGKFIPKKRPLDLVRAAELLLGDDRLTNVYLLFVGSGELGDQLRAECRVVYDQELIQRSENRGQRPDQKEQRINLTSDQSLPAVAGPLTSEMKPPASFAGFLNQTEISRAYVAADALVLPSDGRETWGLVVNEAMACGLPAIVSDAVGCAPDLIDESKTGFTFEVGNTTQLAQRLASFFELKQRRHDFAPALAEKMRTYSVEAAVNGTAKAVNNSIAQSHSNKQS